MTKIKFCGLRSVQDVEIANELSPEFVGFVFARGSRRRVSPELAREMKNALNPAIQAVGVFVRDDIDFVSRLLDDGIIDLAQLHGNETDDYLSALRSRSSKPIIRARSVKTGADIEAARSDSADYVLLDSGGGGTGETFDWSLLRDFDRPYFLAGGLDPENVKKALALLNPYVADVSSGIETDGVKDAKKMAAFVDAVRKDMVR